MKLENFYAFCQVEALHSGTQLTVSMDAITQPLVCCSGTIIPVYWTIPQLKFWGFCVFGLQIKSLPG